MAKRKAGSLIQEKKRKQAKQDADAQLSNGIFSRSINALSDEEDAGDDNGYDDDDNDNNDNGNWDEEEQDYELRPRTLNTEDTEEALPIIGSDGKVQRVLKKRQQPVSKKKEDEEPSDKEDKEAPEPEQESEPESEVEEDDGLTPEQRVQKLQEEIADLATKLIENPEENFAMLPRLRRMVESKNPNTSKLALLALVPIFKSICPSYRIRALTELEQKEKVSRDVAKVRNFEQALVVNYKRYVDLLALKAKITVQSAKDPNDVLMGRFAANAACELAIALRHFNCRLELIQIVCRRVSLRQITASTATNDEMDIKLFKKCIMTLETLLQDDAAAGDISFDVIRILTKTIKARHFKVDESVVNVFLSASVLEDYDPNADADSQPAASKLKKKDRVHLSKKERKARKANKEIEKEMRAAEQAVSEEERDRFQAQILKMLLTIYLELLKNRPESLMASVLEGLAKFGHMANFDLLGDFLQVLREVSADILAKNTIHTESELRQVLLCVVTSFALMQNHAQFKVSVDLSSFINALYRILPDVANDPELEFSHKSLRLADPLSNSLVKPSVNVSTKIEIVLKSLESIFFKSRNGSKLRAAAFTKRIYMALLQTPEKTSIALLKFIENMMSRNTEICGLYSTEDRISNGTFHMDIDDPQRSNPEAATLWETVLLEKHFCPAVAKGAKYLFNKSKESAA